ncbi:MAG: DUF362 domain-containing protein [Desulfomonilaceae bacterium]
MGSPYWIKTLINKTFPQRFFLSRLTRYPLLGSMIDYLLFNEDDILYLPKNRVIQLNENIAAETAESLTAPSRVVEHFIREASFHWRMNFCICRDSEKCSKYPIELGCLFLGEAARGINPEFGQPITMEQALEHVERCREAGLTHLIGRNKLDSVWLNVGPGRNLLTICNCCPCCCLWKILPIVDRRISKKISRMPGVSVSVTDRCVGCGACTAGVCFVDAIHLEGKHAVIDDDLCRGCGRCADICPNDAIVVTVTDTDYIDNAIRRISSVVDVK